MVLHYATAVHLKKTAAVYYCLPFTVLQVHYILQEVVMGGMVLETNMNEIVAQVEVQNRMEKSEVRAFEPQWRPCLFTNI